MRILLFGEYSGLFNCLKDGLMELGCDVFLASNEDGYKNYPSDFNWTSKFRWRFNAWGNLTNILLNKKKLSGYDIVLLINSRPLGFNPFFNDTIFDFLVDNNKKVYLCGAGLDAYAFDFWCDNRNSKLYNYTSNYIKEATLIHKEFPLYHNEKLKKSEMRLFNKINGYIPIMFEYAEPFRAFHQLKKSIPIPINLNKFEYKPNKISNKIVFFHGLSRSCKGGEYIQEAFNILSKKYSNIAEFYCKGGLPFNEYTELIQRVNVVLDQTNSYSLGMNALFSMAQGRVVMGGVENQANIELNYEFNPAFNITSDVCQIVTSIEHIIENRDKLEEIGYKSRLFVEQNHDYITVAKKYLDLWSRD